jgi:hypothetical protein
MERKNKQKIKTYKYYLEQAAETEPEIYKEYFNNLYKKNKKNYNKKQEVVNFSDLNEDELSVI